MRTTYLFCFCPGPYSLSVVETLVPFYTFKLTLAYQRLRNNCRQSKDRVKQPGRYADNADASPEVSTQSFMMLAHQGTFGGFYKANDIGGKIHFCPEKDHL